MRHGNEWNEPDNGGTSSQSGRTAEPVQPSEEQRDVVELHFTVQFYIARVQHGTARGAVQVDTLREVGTELAAALDDVVQEVEDQVGRVGGWEDELLTKRERQVLQAVAEGESIAEVADHLSIAKDTLNKHLSNIRGKLGLRSTAALVAAAWKHKEMDAAKDT